ncbi:hypothetical protein [Candidatus Amarolinea dominans]|uniref:hypothetical protein n=1 Tax=Candidatus Amarolinea dominans TaxID=3140696 RepID=UPI001DE7AEF8|nr:hypothetical protein [Anaerolineae bacterium]
MHHLYETAGTLTLMGSGEMTTTMVHVHRHIMDGIKGTVAPVFIDTPANFELNVDSISQRAVEYFATHFGLTLDTISFPTAHYPTPIEMEAVLRKLRRANYLFAGPGSPTYAVRSWRNTAVFETMAGKLAFGSHLVLASAAVTAMGRFTLPVYEIYKVGLELHWTDGLDLLGRYGLDLAVVPHWNNSSGETHDTSRCFMGEARLRKLEQMLPPTLVILGIDEFTACVMEPAGQCCASSVRAQSPSAPLDGAADRVFRSGETFSFDELRHQGSHRRPAGTVCRPRTPPRCSTTKPAKLPASFVTLIEERNPASAVGYLHALQEAIQTGRRSSLHEAVLPEIERLVREMLALLAIWLEGANQRGFAAAPLISDLVTLRQTLRKDSQWALADQVRTMLDGHNVVVEDSRDGSSWRWAQ